MNELDFIKAYTDQPVQPGSIWEVNNFANVPQSQAHLNITKGNLSTLYRYLIDNGLSPEKWLSGETVTPENEIFLGYGKGAGYKKPTKIFDGMTYNPDSRDFDLYDPRKFIKYPETGNISKSGWPEFGVNVNELGFKPLGTEALAVRTSSLSQLLDGLRDFNTDTSANSKLKSVYIDSPENVLKYSDEYSKWGHTRMMGGTGETWVYPTINKTVYPTVTDKYGGEMNEANIRTKDLRGMELRGEAVLMDDFKFSAETAANSKSRAIREQYAKGPNLNTSEGLEWIREAVNRRDNPGNYGWKGAVKNIWNSIKGGANAFMAIPGIEYLAKPAAKIAAHATPLGYASDAYDAYGVANWLSEQTANFAQYSWDNSPVKNIFSIENFIKE